MIKCWGVRFRFHPLFVMIMVLSVLTGSLLELMTLFAIVLTHELGHLAAAKSFGWPVREVELLPFGGVMVTDIGAAPVWQEIAVSLAGPLQNFILLGFGALMTELHVWDPLWGAYFMKANLMIALFNLMPVLPLDGGKLMQCLFSLWHPFLFAMMAAARLSLVFSILFLGFAVLPVFGHGIRLNLLVIGLFLLYSNWYAMKHAPFYFVRFLVNREVRIERWVSKGTLAQPVVVRRSKSVFHTLRLFMREKYHLIYVLNEKGRIQAVLTEDRLLHTYLVDNQPHRAVSELFM